MQMVDKTIIRAPFAKIQVDTPYFKGEVEALCLNDAIYDLLIGNIPNAKAPENPDESWKASAGKVMENRQVEEENKGEREDQHDGEMEDFYNITRRLFK